MNKNKTGSCSELRDHRHDPIDFRYIMTFKHFFIHNFLFKIRMGYLNYLSSYFSYLISLNMTLTFFFAPVWSLRSTYLHLKSASTCSSRQRVMTYFHKFAVSLPFITRNSYLFTRTKCIIHTLTQYAYQCSPGLPRCHFTGHRQRPLPREPGTTLCGHIFCGRKYGPSHVLPIPFIPLNVEWTGFTVHTFIFLVICSMLTRSN